jgi:hypothetical protein
MPFWLDKHGIRYSSNMTKAELHDLIKMHTRDFCNSSFARRSRTHSDQPTITNWGIVNTRIAANNVTFKLRVVQQLAEKNFVAVTMEEWADMSKLWMNKST